LTFTGTELDFTTTGTAGTTGSYDVTIPVSSVPSQSSIQVLVNGTSIPFTITSDGTNYHVHFTIAFHSSFSVRVITDQKPHARFTFSPANPNVGDTVSFDASTSTDDGSIVSYAWDFGDGTTGSGVTTTHAYTTTGTFTVTLTVTDNSGQTDTATATITVGQVTGAHASFFQWSVRAQWKKFSISQQGKLQGGSDPLQAFVVNDGNQAVWAYVRFVVTNDGGANQPVYTQVVQLNTGQTINGNQDPRFAAAFVPTVPGTYSVQATVYFSTSSTAPPIGDPSFMSTSPNNNATFSFVVRP